mgnify:CR=1 FL=1
MTPNITITTEYFAQYRQKLGFGNQADARNFFGAKDIVPKVDLRYAGALNSRLCEIVDRINAVVVEEIKLRDPDAFKQEKIFRAFSIMRKSGILPILTNQGRRPEQVYFNWMRGYVVSNFFLQAVGFVFETDIANIKTIGDDELKTPDAFKRTPKADLEISLGGKEKLRVEIQSGFAGTNDVKQHKVLEAKRVFRESGLRTTAIHFDLYNGQVAFIKLDEIGDDDVNWITRQQMEGQTVFNISQNHFVWKITEPPVKYKEINFN